MMQIHGPSDCLAAEDISAYVNSPGFTVLQFGPIGFYLDDPQQCDWLIIAATEAKQLLIDNPAKPEADEPKPKPPAVMCECGHFEAYHVGAVLGDKHPGQCTAMVDGSDDCECQRYRPAAGQGGVLLNVGDEDGPAETVPAPYFDSYSLMYSSARCFAG